MGMLSVMQELRIAVRDFSVSASVWGEGETAIVLGHGAGGNRESPFMTSLAAALASSGRAVVLYNFPYSDRGARRPDSTDLLEMTTQQVGAQVREQVGASRLIHGGKSMGGRIASQIVAKGAPADGLVFLGYPLHPPGRPDTLRDRHLPAISVPMLFIQGTRDAFARWDLLSSVLGRLGERAHLHRLDGADHSFKLPKSAGRTDAEVHEEIVQTTRDWLERHGW
jgi:predicted alpha/beta-hydrolase family hydrolase